MTDADAQTMVDDEFYLVLLTRDHKLARVALDCSNEQEALQIAVDVSSPHGHDLYCGSRFLARFGSAWGAHLAEEDAPLV